MRHIIVIQRATVLHYTVDTIIRIYLNAEKVCRRLKNPANGGVIVTGTTLGLFAKYFCNDGFTLVGFKLRRCSHSLWTGKEPTCKGMCSRITIRGTEISYKYIPDFPSYQERIRTGN